MSKSCLLLDNYFKMVYSYNNSRATYTEANNITNAKRWHGLVENKSVLFTFYLHPSGVPHNYMGKLFALLSNVRLPEKTG
jgi:hypothetical protein